MVVGKVDESLGLILKKGQEIGSDLYMYIDIFHKPCIKLNPYEDYILRCLGKRKETRTPKDYKMIKHYNEKRIIGKGFTCYRFCNGEKLGENLYTDYPSKWKPKITTMNTEECLNKKLKYINKYTNIKDFINEY